MPSNSKPRIFTIGHGDSPFHEIEGILHAQGVATIVDVRSTPFSRHAPDFRKSVLSALAAAAGFGYRWIGDRLGGRPSRARPGPSGSVEESPLVVQAALAEVIELNASGSVVLLCAERDPRQCHRSQVLAPQLEALGIEVFHLLEDGTARRHQPSLGI